ncbi:hypothetical protein ERJ75_001606100 [Trypanosoma vivax]|nr:hypothetical protein ERJ75_001606100 [Trypanosoma vivax]
MRGCAAARLLPLARTLVARNAAGTQARRISLSELAKAFTELSEAELAQTAPSIPSPLPLVSATETDAKAGTNITVDVHGVGSSTSFASSPQSSAKLQMNPNVLTFSTTYRNALRSLAGPVLAVTLERECKRANQGCMLQGLVEVWRRLRAAPPSAIAITHNEACSTETASPNHSTAILHSAALALPANFVPFRSDYLLECVLRALAKLSLDDVQQSCAAVESIGDGAPVTWVSEFSDLLLQWLNARAACLSASRSATFLHLIAQQRLLHSDTVLETLCDNTMLFIRRQRDDDDDENYACSLLTSSRAATGHVASAASDLSFYSVLLDAISRWQTRFTRLIRADVMGSCGIGGSDTLSAAISKLGHSVLNHTFYSIVVEGFLAGVRDGSLHLTKQSSPATFLFLTLALAKIKWFDPECAAVLLPQLHEALRVFPGQFLGVVLLLGRREVTACEPATTELILLTLLNAMQKRGHRFQKTALHGPRRHSTDDADTDPLDDSIETLNGDSVDCGAPLAMCDENDESDPLMVPLHAESLSTSSPDMKEEVGTKDGSKDIPALPSAAVTEVDTGSFSTSFLDLRSIPVFIDGLNHIISTTVKHCVAQGNDKQCSSIQAQSAALYDAVLNDVHTSVKSLQFLLHRPALVERLLLSALAIPRETVHPFMIELAFVFTRHVGERRIKTVGTGGSQGPVTFWQRRALAIVELLVQRGIVINKTYAMPHDVVCLSPRVAAAVESIRAQLRQENACQNEEGRHSAHSRDQRRSVAVFSKFAAAVRRMKKYAETPCSS